MAFEKRQFYGKKTIPAMRIVTLIGAYPQTKKAKKYLNFEVNHYRCLLKDLYGKPLHGIPIPGW